ncbi:hypothetical protein [Photorhabdus hindustanensis]|uniref:hypothetical protein n=1 Tax=Photorhabdus hindustanensis TaxID=2918802 RepID=UPI002000C6E6|nr:hypothetical protein [Photorhabdus hindustanensis]
MASIPTLSACEEVIGQPNRPATIIAVINLFTESPNVSGLVLHQQELDFSAQFRCYDALGI